MKEDITSGLRRIAARRASQALDTPLTDLERGQMIDAAALKISELFDILCIDHPNDHHTRDTPHRVAKSLVNELLAGRYAAAPQITDFENAEGFDDLIITGPIKLNSLCAHHMLPIYGEAYFGIQPNKEGRIVGLSKYDRIVEYFSRRMHCQEELVNLIGNFMVELTNPAGLCIRISAVHMCKTHRGVGASHAGRMVSTFAWGTLKADRELRAEFNAECLALTSEN